MNIFISPWKLTQWERLSVHIWGSNFTLERNRADSEINGAWYCVFFNLNDQLWELTSRSVQNVDHEWGWKEGLKVEIWGPTYRPSLTRSQDGPSVKSYPNPDLSLTSKASLHLNYYRSPKGLENPFTPRKHHGAGGERRPCTQTQLHHARELQS